MTLWYRAPEIIKGKTDYGFEVDIWSLGIILIEKYLGYLPFKGQSQIEHFNLLLSNFAEPNKTKPKWT